MRELLEGAVDKVVADKVHTAGVEQILKFLHADVLRQFFVAGLDPADTEIQFVFPRFDINIVPEELG